MVVSRKSIFDRLVLLNGEISFSAIIGMYSLTVAVKSISSILSSAAIALGSFGSGSCCSISDCLETSFFRPGSCRG